MNTPDPIVDLYEEAQINEDMDCGTYVGGTDSYGVTRILEAIAQMVGWVLPPKLTMAERQQWLINNGREDEIDLLGVMDSE